MFSPFVACGGVQSYRWRTWTFVTSPSGLYFGLLQWEPGFGSFFICGLEQKGWHLRRIPLWTRRRRGRSRLKLENEEHLHFRLCPEKNDQGPENPFVQTVSEHCPASSSGWNCPIDTAFGFTAAIDASRTRSVPSCTKSRSLRIWNEDYGKAEQIAHGLSWLDEWSAIGSLIEQ